MLFKSSEATWRLDAREEYYTEAPSIASQLSRTLDHSSCQLSYEATDSGFIAQLVRVSHQYRDVTGSNLIEVLTFSGFYAQLLKLRS